MFRSLAAAVAATLVGGGLAIATIIGIVSSVQSEPSAQQPADSSVVNYGSSN